MFNDTIPVRYAVRACIAPTMAPLSAAAMRKEKRREENHQGREGHKGRGNKMITFELFGTHGVFTETGHNAALVKAPMNYALIANTGFFVRYHLDID